MLVKEELVTVKGALNGPQHVEQMFSSHQVSNTGSIESLLHIISIALRCKIRFSDCNSDFQKYN